MKYCICISVSSETLELLNRLVPKACRDRLIDALVKRAAEDLHTLPPQAAFTAARQLVVPPSSMPLPD
jgi:hypothetical protein